VRRYNICALRAKPALISLYEDKQAAETKPTGVGFPRTICRDTSSGVPPVDQASLPFSHLAQEAEVFLWSGCPHRSSLIEEGKESKRAGFFQGSFITQTSAHELTTPSFEIPARSGHPSSSGWLKRESLC
jgi:hypothetical protein